MLDKKSIKEMYYERKISEFVGAFQCVEDERILYVRFCTINQLGHLCGISKDETIKNLHDGIIEWFGYDMKLPKKIEGSELEVCLRTLKRICLKSTVGRLTKWLGTAKAILSR